MCTDLASTSNPWVQFVITPSVQVSPQPPPPPPLCRTARVFIGTAHQIAKVMVYSTLALGTAFNAAIPTSTMLSSRAMNDPLGNGGGLGAAAGALCDKERGRGGGGGLGPRLG